MCGRYALTLPPEAVRALFAYADQPNFPPRFNIAPTQPVPVVLAENGARRFRLMRWGFLPGWVKDPKDYPLVINVRSETAREKASFRAAVTRRRCLMPADGFYEWRRMGRENWPYLFRRPDLGAFAFAAVHETWSSPDGSEIDTVALMNTGANGLMAPIHHRCPILIEPRDFDLWLDAHADPRHIDALLRPPPDDALELVRITTAVNKVANDGAEVQRLWTPDDEPAPHGPAPGARKAKPVKTASSAKDDAQGSLF
jgi:putative SOS response-associated peptidase YedK